MKKKIISVILASSMAALALFSPGVASIAADEQSITVTAPTRPFTLSFWLENGSAYYSVTNGDTVMVEPSQLGLVSSIADFQTGLQIKSVTEDSYSGTWTPLVGEQTQIDESYQEKTVVLSHDSGRELTIQMRAYDTGVAFRYILPQFPAELDSYQITDELTRFTFPEGAFAAAHAGMNQSVPQKIDVANFASDTYFRPLTVSYPNGMAMTICEADLENYAVMTMQKDASLPRTLKAQYVSYTKYRVPVTSGPEVTITADGPSATPWRVFVMADSETGLLENSSIVQSLNPAPDEDTYHFSEWVKPGVSLRAVSGMNTTAIKDIIDQAVTHQIPYVLLDAGWYGPEGDPNCDPRLDPTKLDPNNPDDKLLLDQYFGKPGEGKYGTGEGIFNTRGVGFDNYAGLGAPGTQETNVDIPAICDYANANGVGIILYTNGVYLPDCSGRDRFTIDELFSYYEKWGVKGVKPGFVDVRAQEFEKNVQTVIEAAARHKLIMTIHDEFVSTGEERTFPNLLCTEGIYGDEAVGRYGNPDGSVNPQAAEDIATLFTRPVQGPTDHTYCYPGKATKAYAIASPILFKTGLQSLYWYTYPNNIPKLDYEKVSSIWDGLPATWEQSLYLEGKLFEYATFARKSFNGDWYIGSLSAVDRTLEVPLTFLDTGVKYVANIYRDGADADPYAGFNAESKGAQTLLNFKYIVDSSTVLSNAMSYATGYAVKLTPATETDLNTLPAYSKELTETEEAREQERIDNLISVRVNKEPLVFADTEPVMTNDRVLVPFRAIFERLGASVTWDEATATATATKGDTTIRITENSDTAYINDSPCTLDVGATILNGRFIVPIRFVSEALGCIVYWDEGRKTVVILESDTRQDRLPGSVPIVDCTFNSYQAGADEIGQLSYDGNPDTVWSAEGEGVYVCYDLGAVTPIQKVSIMWNKGDVRQQYFEIHLSDDGVNFRQVFDGASSGTNASYEDYALENASARYVKIVCNNTTEGTWNAIKEIYIYQ